MKLKDIDKTKLTPMMKQYVEIKENNMDLILFYRLGDFYELFFEDALIAAKELELVLTGRDCGLDKRAPMAGIPHHSASSYINRMVEKGYKIAIVEQVEDPKLAQGIVKRSIVKIISPGTILELDGKEKLNNFLSSIFYMNDSFGISYIDITTGEFKTTEFLNSNNVERELLDFIVKINPREIILNKNINFKSFNEYIKVNNISISILDVKDYNIKKANQNIKKKLKFYDETNFMNKIFSILSSSILLDYIYLFREEELNHIDNLEYIENNNFMKLDANTRQNLEIHKNINSGLNYTLLNVLDKASTSMGSRKINNWLEFPLVNKDKINERLDIVDYLLMNNSIRLNFTNILENIYDLERILSKISYQSANPKDLLILKNSLYYLPEFKKILQKSDNKYFSTFYDNFDDLNDLYKLINDSIREDASLIITEGNIIKDGFNIELDRIKFDSIEGSKELIEYEKKEKEKTGLSKLKVAYNKNTGYYIELTKSQISKAPDNYIRLQTLKNSERYITEELKIIANKILGSKTEIEDLEYKIFCDIREKISNNAHRIKRTTDIISTIDALTSFAKIARDYKYIRPIFNDENYFLIKEGRHPVVEASIGRNEFIANDTRIGKDNNIIQIITGPNMAGKSTYMRQVALIVLMAQIGSFVPAKSCDLSISDAIFTRIGASDNLAKGDSTFMVEMKEMSNIINNANKNSFVILDEVGRGTGTDDGYSIAKAIVEYISTKNKSKTLFATHYHELTELSKTLDNVENLKVDIKEMDDEIIFLRKIVKGKSDKSYGIEVAKLSGLPEEIIFRANSILESLDNSYKIKENEQISFINHDKHDFKKDILIKELNSIDIDNLTPLKAIEILNNFKYKAKDILNDKDIR